MKYLPIILLLCACEDLLTFHPVGGEKCIELSPDNIVVGDEVDYYTCHPGISYYEQEDLNSESVLKCSGGSMPTEEQCGNNIDDDCDGYVDNVYYYQFDERNTCNQTEEGVCKLSVAQCVDGHMQCVPPEGLYGPELCDKIGLDENCNGLVNEDDPSLVLDGEEWVYEGEPQTLNVGECRAGHKQCMFGNEVVYGMRTPVKEICGNGDDDDCDGLTDEQELDGSNIDFLISVDGSGSMDDMHSILNTTICLWSSEQRWENSRFAIVFFAVNPDIEEYVDFNGVRQANTIYTVTDFTDATTACARLTSFLNGISTTFDEYQLDSIFRTFYNTDPIFLNWSSNIRKVMLFTDEEIQTQFTDPEQIVIDSCIQNDYSVGMFLSEYAYNDIGKWNNIAVECGGFVDEIVSEPEIMIDKLNYWFGESC